MDSTDVTLFAVCALGLEPALLAEAQALPGVRSATAEAGGVLLVGPPALLGQANLRLRTASRVLLRLSRFRATRLPQLVAATAALPWERYLRAPVVQASVTCHRSRIYHNGAAAERLALGIGARLGVPVTVQAGAQKVLLRGVSDEWELSLDSSGELLHRRGYRLEAGEAPLRETLAAGLLLQAGYTGGPLLDLCSGAGTFALEAGLLRRRLAPGLLRRFAFQDWPMHDAAAFSRQREATLAEARPEDGAPAIIGVDREPQACERARHNAERAGLLGTVLFQAADLFLSQAGAELRAAFPGELLTVTANPPYGQRIGARGQQPAFYRRLGRHLRAHFAQSPLVILSGHRHGAASMGLGPPTLRLRNGGLPIEVILGPSPAP